MSAMSGLPTIALVKLRSERMTWLLLIGTATSPAWTPSATLMALTWASAGAAAIAPAKKAAAIMAIARGRRVMVAVTPPVARLLAISPHLIVGTDRPPDDLDIILGRLRLAGRSRRAAHGPLD